MLRTEAQFSSEFSRCSAQERNFRPYFQRFSSILRMLRTGARFSSNFQDALHGSAIFFFQNVEDAPHRSAIFFNIIFEMLRVGARFCMKLSGFSAWERDICPNLQDAPRRDTILNDNADESYTKASFTNDPNFPNALRGSLVLIEFDEVNRQNFEDAPRGSAIFEEIKIIQTSKVELSRAGAQFSSKRKRNFKDVPRGSAILQNRGATGSGTDPSSLYQTKMERSHLLTRTTTASNEVRRDSFDIIRIDIETSDIIVRISTIIMMQKSTCLARSAILNSS